MKHSYLASLLFGRPLAIERSKLRVILHVLHQRLEIEPPMVTQEELAAHTMKPSRTAVAGPSSAPEPRIAVIDVMDSLVHRTRGLEAESGLSSYESIGNQLVAAARDPLISGILLHVDSPGGEVAGAFPLASLIGDVRREKPVWASVDESAWSAGYLIASQADRVYLSKNGSVGSIGIIMAHVDESAKDEKEGKKYTFLSRGERKADFNPHGPLSEDALTWANEWLDREYGMFIEAVVAGRGLTAKKVRETEARLLSGDESIAGGFADGYLSYRDSVGEMLSHVAPKSISTMKGGSATMAEPVIATVTTAGSTPSPPVAPEPLVLTRNEAEEIAEACAIAGKKHLAADFILAKLGVAEVKKRLLSAAAEADEKLETNTAIDPQFGTKVDAKPKQSLADRMRLRFQKEAGR